MFPLFISCYHFLSIFIKLTGNKDRHGMLDGFELPDLTSHFGVTCPGVVKNNNNKKKKKKKKCL